jgi:DNA-binding Xre family transcriptional regulator
MAIHERVAVNVKKMLAERHTSAKTMYEAIGIPERTGARRLSGKSRWNTDELEAVANYLEVNPADLLEEIAA